MSSTPPNTRVSDHELPGLSDSESDGEVTERHIEDVINITPPNYDTPDCDNNGQSNVEIDLSESFC